MVPGFGFLSRERTAGVLMLLGGLISLILLIGKPETFVGHGLFQASRAVLILQSFLVILGAVGAFGGTFTAVAVGTASALMPTAVGFVTFLPSLGVLLFAFARRQAFFEFRPRWRGPGPPPPGSWR
jgi:hypothetical protein